MEKAHYQPEGLRMGIRVLMVGRRPSIALNELRRYWGEVDVAKAPKTPFKRYDLVVAQEPSRRCGLPAYLHASLYGERWICEVHGEYLQYLKLPELALAKWLLRRADAVRAVNKGIAYALKRFGVKNVLYAPSVYVNTELFHPLTPHEKRERLVLFVGRFVFEKGFDLLFKSFKVLLKKMPDAKLRLIGRGPEANRILGYVKSLELGGRVELIGWLPQSELVKHYNEASVYACTSKFEGGPRTLFEACACETPFVSTPVGVVKDVATNGKEGFITEGDPLLFAKRLETLLNDVKLREEMGKQARMLVLKHFEWTKAVKRYALTYIDFLKRFK